MLGCFYRQNVEENTKSRSSQNAAAVVNERRSCTDILFFVVFFLYICGLILISASAIQQGDFWRLIYGVDSFGNTCGRNNSPSKNESSSNITDLTSKPYLFPMNSLEPFDSVWICVASCSNETINDREQLKGYAELYGVGFCSYEVPIDEYTLTEDSLHSNLSSASMLHLSSTVGPCPVLPIFQSTHVLHRCVPKIVRGLTEQVSERLLRFLSAEMDFFKQTVADLAVCFNEIVALCFLAFVLSFCFLLIVRFVASIVIHFLFIMVAIGCIAFSCTLWYLFVCLRFHDRPVEELQAMYGLVTSHLINAEVFLVLAVIATIVTTLLAYVICCLRGRVAFVVDLFREASQFIQTVPCALLQPLITFVVLISFFVFWCFVLLVLATAGHKTKVFGRLDADRSQNQERQQYAVDFIFIQFNPSNYLCCFWWYHVIGLVWIAEFILACQQMVIAGAVSVWYFTRAKQEVTWYVLIQSTQRLLFYHIGSIALGSFIITVVKLPRLILAYVVQRLKGINSYRIQGCLRSCAACLMCIERFLRYIHHSAYTIIAIEGRSFCPAAKQAFEIMAQNPLNVAALNTAGDLILFLGKCAVTSIVAFIAALIFKNNAQVYYLVPLVLVSVLAFLISHCFFSIYEMVIDTLFLCYCQDRQMQDGVETTVDATGVHQLYASKEFANLMNSVSLEETRRMGQLKFNDCKRESGDLAHPLTSPAPTAICTTMI